MRFWKYSQGGQPHFPVIIFLAYCLYLGGLCLAQQTTTSPSPYNLKGYQLITDGNAPAFKTHTCWESQTFSRMTKGLLAGCCPTYWKTCDFATACESKTRRWLYGSTDYCGSSETCFSATVYNIFPSQYATQSWIDIGCRGSTEKESTLYWETTAAAATAPTTSAQPPTFSTFTSTTTTSGPTSSSSSAPSNTSTTTHPIKSTASKAWIAGAVIGPLAVVGLFLGFCFWLRLRHKANKQNTSMGYNATAGGDDILPPGTTQPYLVPTQPYHQQGDDSFSSANNVSWVKPQGNNSPPPVVTQIQPSTYQGRAVELPVSPGVH
ncbi:hypothetical protein QBC38DRAFT_498593 [Podospora fimiseda]|uniref:Mid2 domain-containing protein n=1 Tax=Podospora fimiseda TaxID=252190 RepID=A0AAN7BRV8_9PEZI|nr:hypothetical protein QBC38DRAFT_498593 [Podospora fimiseda]